MDSQGKKKVLWKLALAKELEDRKSFKTHKNINVCRKPANTSKINNNYERNKKIHYCIKSII